MLSTNHAVCLPTPVLVQEENWAKLQAAFEQEGSVQLQNFLTASWAEQVAAAVAAADAAAKAGRGQVPAYDAGICGGWQAVGPCHKQRYLRYAPATANGGDGEGAAAASAVGGVLAQIRDELFSTAAFARLLTKVGGRRWRGGQDRDMCALQTPAQWGSTPFASGMHQPATPLIQPMPCTLLPNHAVHNHRAGGAAERGEALPPGPGLHSGALRRAD